MKKETLVFLLLFVIVFALADVHNLRFSLSGGSASDSIAQDSIPADSVKKLSRKKASGKKVASVADSLSRDSLQSDTAQMDSLQKLIWKHNKQIDDSLRADSLNRQRKNGIDAPVEYTAEDSMVYEGDTKMAHLFGNSHVKYENMDLESDQIQMSMDSSLVHYDVFQLQDEEGTHQQCLYRSGRRFHDFREVEA